MKVNEFDYELPERLIAQKPEEKRDECRLMVLDRNRKDISHKQFKDCIDYFEPGDCLVINDSRVIPARLLGHKETGAKIEFLITKHIEGNKWQSLVRPGKKLKPGSKAIFSDIPGRRLEAEVLEYSDGGTRIVEFDYDGNFMERLAEFGAMPLPPYIERPGTEEDKETYQTVYSRHNGSVAAPTAGLHFTEELFEKLKERGVKIARVTLHVGIGTFRPVKCENVEDHHMHFEEYDISEETAELINQTKKKGGKIVCVGTTSTRTLESAAEMTEEGWKVKPGRGSTGIFIYPGYSFKITDRLITNFHLPKSTLLMLVSALYDREHILEGYNEAVREEYRFFSYGDAMFIY